MCDTTKKKIASYDTNALNKLLYWYGVTDFDKIPETSALKFLKLLERGDIKF